MSKVSRSVYQKLKEENNRLTKDIEALVNPKTPLPELYELVSKYRDQLRKKEEFNYLMKILAQQRLYEID